MSVDHSELPKPPQSSAASLSVVTLKFFSAVGAICKHDNNNDDDDGDALKLSMEYEWNMDGIWIDYGWTMDGIWMDYGWTMGGIWMIKNYVFTTRE